MIGKDEYWRGAMLARGRKEKKKERKKPVPVDLDTASLPIVLPLFKWEAICSDAYGLAEEAEEVTPEKAAPKKERRSNKRKEHE